MSCKDTARTKSSGPVVSLELAPAHLGTWRMLSLPPSRRRLADLAAAQALQALQALQASRASLGGRSMAFPNPNESPRANRS